MKTLREYITEAEENIDALFYEGKIIASSILSEGYPVDWNSENVVTAGILTDNKINETKVERFLPRESVTEYKTISPLRFVFVASP